MDCDQEGMTSDSSFDDNESDLEIDESDTIIESGNEEEDEEEEDDDEEELEWNWSQDFVPDEAFSFNEVEGHTTITSGNNIQPIEIFNKFFTNDVIALIVNQTNTYGEQRCSSLEHPSNWNPVNDRIICCFLGLLIIMGLHQLPRIRNYWSRNKIFYTEVVANTMPRNEFYRIFSALHLADNTKQKKFPKSSEKFKLFKIFDFVQLLKKNFQANFTLGTNISIDESMIKFKGKSSLKQYLPMKPIKRGYKVWCLVDSSNGYLYNFNIYTGKLGKREGTLAESVISRLIHKINLVDHQIFFDNFYTSVLLLLRLRKKKIGATGTIRKNRKLFPVELLPDEKMKRGEYKFKSCNQISIVKWQDTKPVFVASNCFDPRKTELITRKMKDGTKQNIICPQMISKYNRFMGGVDRFDQRITCYALDRKSK